MKKLVFLFSLFLGGFSLHSCQKEITEKNTYQTIKYKNSIPIDSMFAYHGDSIYKSLVNLYNQTNNKSRALSAEDDAFFNKKYIVKTSEPLILYGKNYIYPGSILEGNSISNQKYVPVFLQQRNPITVSMTLNHNHFKSTTRTIEAPTLSKLNEYVKEMVIDGNFQNNEKFMFQQKRFTFYDEIKSAFGSNIDTRKLFSSRKEQTTEHREKIIKSTGIYIKFFQSCFTINVDIAPLSKNEIKGKTPYEPVYVASVTYGRTGILTLETDETYEFAEKCIAKEFNRIFYNKEEVLSEKEKRFFDQTEFKVLIIGGDSDYTVQTIKGYPHFLNMIYNSKFSENNYGVPISCTFAHANTHELVETEFINTIHIEPLFVSIKRSHTSREEGQYSNFHSTGTKMMLFYKDREKTKPAIPYIDILFKGTRYERITKYKPNFPKWPMLIIDSYENAEEFNLRNINLKTEMYLGTDIDSFNSTGKMPSDLDEPRYEWSAQKTEILYSLSDSPFLLLYNKKTPL